MSEEKAKGMTVKMAIPAGVEQEIRDKTVVKGGKALKLQDTKTLKDPPVGDGEGHVSNDVNKSEQDVKLEAIGRRQGQGDKNTDSQGNKDMDAQGDKAMDGQRDKNMHGQSGMDMNT